MNAQQIPDRHLEMTADVVRLARAADGTTRAADIRDGIARAYPEASDDDIRMSLGYAARMLLDQHS